MTIKTLLVALSTTREVDSKNKRVRFAAGETVDLTDAELKTLDDLTVSTGALQYRDPVNETVTSTGTVATDRRFVGEDVAVDKKNMDQLKAFLGFYNIEFAADAKKADLVTLAEGVDVAAAEAALAAGGNGGEDEDDQDAGL